MRKKIMIAVLLSFLAIQFFPPEKNTGTVEGPNFIGQHFAMPEDIHMIMQKACYDCHSNQTNYPWYTHIQPAGWWMQNHVEEGKRKLNFSEFAAYTAKKQDHKMEELIEMVQENLMPLNSYTWIHQDAVLSPKEKESILAWAQEVRNQISVPTH